MVRTPSEAEAPARDDSARSGLPRYGIRGAGPEDLEQVLALSRHLNTVNLPNDAAHIARLLTHSGDSFAGRIEDPWRRKYVFLVHDRESGRAVGTSTLVAQLGRKDAPYIFLEVLEEEKYSKALDKHFSHTVLHIGFSYDGPTELAGLVVNPDYRGAPERLGFAISYVRFLYIAAHPELFREELLAELLPPLEPDGTSHLWEALGRRFTDMSYGEADLLSSEDKTFIRDLFPSGSIYASLLDPAAQSVIGVVGEQTRGVERMLLRAGFHYASRIDPFDGGPHFVADQRDVAPIRSTETRKVMLRTGSMTDPLYPALVGRDLDGPPYFLAEPTAISLPNADYVALDPVTARALDVTNDSRVWVLRMDLPPKSVRARKRR
jgi:arginine N-succinyltransferase